MTSYFDLSPGEYQAEVAAVDLPVIIGDTIVLFRLTEPRKEDHKNPQQGLGGRFVRAWYSLGTDNSHEFEQETERAGQLLAATGKATLALTVGEIVRIRVARVIMRSDPSKYKTAVVEVLPLFDPNVREYVG